MTTFENTQISPKDGRRYPLGHSMLIASDEQPAELPPGVAVNPEVGSAELASVASGMPVPEGAEAPEPAAVIDDGDPADGVQTTTGHHDPGRVTSDHDQGGGAEPGASTGPDESEIADQDGSAEAGDDQGQGIEGEGQDDGGSDDDQGQGSDDSGSSDDEGGNPPAGETFDVENATKDELVAFAGQQDPPIEVHTSKKVDEVRDEVKAALAERS